MLKKTVMIIDDDVYIGDMLQELLEKNDYNVTRAYSGTEALYAVKNERPDLILLDLMLPGISGEQLLSEIRDIPVIVVSAKADVDNKVNLLLSGAIDYVTKPFDTKELLARISAHLRNNTRRNDKLIFDGITLDISDFSVEVDNSPVKLTRTEYAILFALMNNGGRAMSKDAIMAKIEDVTPDCEESSLRTHVGNLRTKLKAINGKDYIEAVWGIGYKLKS
ncbi:MAG: response regulator transcription factor [Clostridia bacterium]|nr:response regulator transcription factor [Clostridia bacterium]MDE7215898.1 response regulator transcription factor [Clostridia bacterium]